MSEPPLKKARLTARILDFSDLEEDNSLAPLEDLVVSQVTARVPKRAPSPPSSPFAPLKAKHSTPIEIDDDDDEEDEDTPESTDPAVAEVPRSSDRGVTLDDLDEEYQELANTLVELSGQVRDLSMTIGAQVSVPSDLESVNSDVSDIKADIARVKFSLGDMLCTMNEFSDRVFLIETRLDNAETREKKQQQQQQPSSSPHLSGYQDVAKMVDNLHCMASRLLKESNRLRRFYDRIRQAVASSYDDDEEGEKADASDHEEEEAMTQ